MFESLVTVIGNLLLDFVFYRVGRWTLLLLTVGYYDTTKRRTKEGLVELLGFFVVLLMVIAAVLWNDARHQANGVVVGTASAAMLLNRDIAANAASTGSGLAD